MAAANDSAICSLHLIYDYYSYILYIEEFLS